MYTSIRATAPPVSAPERNDGPHQPNLQCGRGRGWWLRAGARDNGFPESSQSSLHCKLSDGGATLPPRVPREDQRGGGGGRGAAATVVERLFASAHGGHAVPRQHQHHRGGVARGGRGGRGKPAGGGGARGAALARSPGAGAHEEHHEPVVPVAEDLAGVNHARKSGTGPKDVQRSAAAESPPPHRRARPGGTNRRRDRRIYLGRGPIRGGTREYMRTREERSRPFEANRRRSLSLGLSGSSRRESTWYESLNSRDFGPSRTNRGRNSVQ
eukprot:618819-Prorocentrum_minimum.AAC.1